jgi:ActR/RegA family two-component response regulator
MIDFRVAVRTTLLLVDDDIQQLDLLAFTMKMSGFTVVTASSPIQGDFADEPTSFAQNRCWGN